MERALLLTAAIESEARAKGLAIMHCRVAQDIDANMFWAAAGFEVVGEATSTKWNQGVSAARRPLYIYEKGLDQLRLLDARGGTASVALR
jgi:predicted GNAT superfamily acetyltransferase